MVLGRAPDEGRGQAPGEADEQEGEDDVECRGWGCRGVVFGHVRSGRRSELERAWGVKLRKSQSGRRGGGGFAWLIIGDGKGVRISVGWNWKRNNES